MNKYRKKSLKRAFKREYFHTIKKQNCFNMFQSVSDISNINEINLINRRKKSAKYTI